MPLLTTLHISMEGLSSALSGSPNWKITWEEQVCCCNTCCILHLGDLVHASWRIVHLKGRKELICLEFLWWYECKECWLMPAC